MIAKITSGGDFRGVLEYLMQPKKGSRKDKEHEAKEPERKLELDAQIEHTEAVGRCEKNLNRERFAGQSRDEKSLETHERNASENGIQAKKKDRHRIIGGNMTGQKPSELAREFRAFREAKPAIKKLVHHVSLSTAEGEKLSDKEWNEIAGKYIRRMGFGASPYIVIQHIDTEQDHIHIVTSRVDVRGRVVSEFQSKTRAEGIVRDLEREHNLIQVKGSRETQRAAPKRGELERFNRTGELSVKMRLQGHVDVALRGSRTATDFVEKLSRIGVEVIPNLQNTGRVSGVSFRLGGELMKGSNLGPGYSWNGLQKRGLLYMQERDLTAFQKAQTGLNVRGEQSPILAAPIPELGNVPPVRQREKLPSQYSLERNELIRQAESQEQTRAQFERKGADGRGIAQDLLTRQGSVEELQRAAGIEPSKDSREAINRLNKTAGVERAEPVFVAAREEEKVMTRDQLSTLTPERASDKRFR